MPLNKKSLSALFLGVIVVVAFLGWYLFNHSSLRIYSQQFLHFGTVVEVRLVTDSNKFAQKLFAHIDQELARMHQEWHAWEPSLITQINQHCDTQRSMLIPADLAELLTLGKKYSSMSNGLFNPAAAKVINAWGFLSSDPNRERQPPDPEVLKTLVNKHPSMNDVIVQDNRVRCINSAVQLDMGGYAKGFAIDQLFAYLESQNVTNGLIDAGGDIGVRGQAINRPWKVAIQNPGSANPIKVLEVSGRMSIFTSGNYARAFEYKNNHYTHIIDPRSGQPVRGLIAVTVLHEDATLADASATALMVAGAENWQEIAQRFGIKKVYAMTSEQLLEWPNKN